MYLKMSLRGVKQACPEHSRREAIFIVVSKTRLLRFAFRQAQDFARNDGMYF